MTTGMVHGRALLGMISCATAGIAFPSHGQTEIRPEVSSRAAKPGQVDLSGIGDVRIEADPAPFAPYAAYLGQDLDPEVIVHFDAAGRPIECNPVAADAPVGLIEPLCAELLAKAHLDLPAGYDLVGQRGFLPVFAYGSTPKIEAVEPIAFLPEGEGQVVSVFAAGGANSGRGPCLAMEVDGGERFSDASKQAICAAFQRDIEGSGCLDSGVAGPGPQGWRCWVATRQVQPGTPPDIAVGDRPLDPGVAPVYPPLRAAKGRLLPNGEAGLQLDVTKNDYPLFAVRYEWEGQTQILIGVEHGNPRVVSCRPIVSSGYPVLDNTACRIALSRGRIVLAPKAPGFAGTRYIVQSIAWALR